MPADMFRHFDLNSSMANVSWTAPSASDNSGSPIQLQSTHNPGSLFGVGYTVVSYTALDSAGNEVTLTFTVNVRGTLLIFVGTFFINLCLWFAR